MDLRTRKNWTQEKPADKAVVSVCTVKNIERGRPTQRSTLARLADALGVSARDLVFVVAPAQTTPYCGYRPSWRLPQIETQPGDLTSEDLFAALDAEAAEEGEE